MQLSTVKVKFSNNSEINVLTTKTKVAEILQENHILLLENEKTTPELEDEIDENSIIIISEVGNEVVMPSNEVEDTTIENLDNEYLAITEKIITIKEEIPYETVEKDISNNSEKTSNKVLQDGEKGIREIKYRVKYKGKKELSRELISTKVVKEPVDRIVQVVSKQVTSRNTVNRTSSKTIAKKIDGVEPKVVTMNVSAYTASTCGKSTTDSGYGVTASGSKASEWYTVAAGKGYDIGTVIYIPYFKNKPNGGWFVVQDRGGSISNSKIDIYMGSYSECIQFGRKSLECYVYEV